eukprot:jgi/Chlat1/8036/Chrsp71S07511
MKSMGAVPPLTLACWRLQVTTAALVPGAAVQWRSLAQEDRQRWKESASSLGGSGTFLAAHFGLWVWSLGHTSLPHSLLFVCSIPLLVTIFMWIRRETVTRWELAGILLGASGTVLLATSAKGEAEVSILGDAAALAAAAAFVGYISIGQRLRTWMPLFLYALPVTAVAAALLGVAALAAGARFNALLRWISPLVISMSISVEPVLGSLLGWMIGVSDFPGPWTCVGGAILITSTCIVQAATACRPDADDIDDKEETFNMEQGDDGDESAGLLTPKQQREVFPLLRSKVAGADAVR